MEACRPRPKGIARELQLCVAVFCCSWLELQTGFVTWSPLAIQSEHCIIQRCPSIFIYTKINTIQMVGNKTAAINNRTKKVDLSLGLVILRQGFNHPAGTVLPADVIANPSLQQSLRQWRL